METESEKRVDTIFEVGVIIKSIQGVLEIIAGLLLIFINTNSLIQFIETYTHEELIENSHDIVSNSLLYIGQHISSNNFFAIFYLLSHGFIKLFLILGLFHKKLWAYYTFIWIIFAFVCYQVYRLNISYSPMLLIFTLFDVLLIYLTWLESKILKRHLKKLVVI
ncbi:MAG: DUF2127 domain-containing protein [Candidatus Falkowbacteria bacterium]|nr:DUF2127 domain-containing protein [Candidatus Falkowbacteria bacterium]